MHFCYVDNLSHITLLRIWNLHCKKIVIWVICRDFCWTENPFSAVYTLSCSGMMWVWLHVPHGIGLTATLLKQELVCYSLMLRWSWRALTSTITLVGDCVIANLLWEKE